MSGKLEILHGTRDELQLITHQIILKLSHLFQECDGNLRAFSRTVAEFVDLLRLPPKARQAAIDELMSAAASAENAEAFEARMRNIFSIQEDED